jgi:hypothetical protein
VGVIVDPRFGEDLPMEGLLAVVLWTLAGSYLGGLIERVSGLAVTVPMMRGFPVAGVCLAVRITRTATSAAVVQLHPTSEQIARLTA